MKRRRASTPARDLIVPDTHYRTFEEWQDALRHHGRILVSYDPYAHPPQDPELPAASMRWVADHHVQLWD